MQCGLLLPIRSYRTCATPVDKLKSGPCNTTGINMSYDDSKTAEAKLRQFLNRLVKLAEDRSKDVQDKIQSHVQHLLVSVYG